MDRVGEGPLTKRIDWFAVDRKSDSEVRVGPTV